MQLHTVVSCCNRYSVIIEAFAERQIRGDVKNETPCFACTTVKHGVSTDQGAVSVSHTARGYRGGRGALPKQHFHYNGGRLSYCYDSSE